VLVSEAPNDGTTVASVGSITLTANQAVTWKSMTVTRPDGSVASLEDAAGQGWTWPFATNAPGLYVVRGTMLAGGSSTDIRSHFTIWTPGGDGASVPPVAKNAVPYAASELHSADGLETVSWPVGAFGDAVVVEMTPTPPSSLSALPSNALVVDVTAFLRSNHAPVTDLGDVVDIRFTNAGDGTRPVSSQDGASWRDIPQLPTLNLPDGQRDGWFRDSDGTVHVLTRHLTYYALIGRQTATRLELRVTTVRRLWLENRAFIAVRMRLTAPARVTGNFVAPDGSIVKGQTLKTPTRHAGVTILRMPLRVTKPGLYRLQIHADGIGQTLDRTAKIRLVARQPASPIWQDGAIRVAVVRGARGLRTLDRRLGGSFVVRRVADAALYDVVDTAYRSAAAVVVVDLGTVPPYTLAELHALLPEVQIIGIADSPRKLAYYHRLGVHTVLPHGASAAQVARAVKLAVR
jgi:hypothetical protein